MKIVLDMRGVAQYIVGELTMRQLSNHTISQNLRWWWWHSVFSHGESVNG